MIISITYARRASTEAQERVGLPQHVDAVGTHNAIDALVRAMVSKAPRIARIRTARAAARIEAHRAR